MKFKRMEFKGKNVLITGGTKGIGQHIANAFYSHGAKVIVLGTNSKRINDINLKNNADFVAVKCDFTDKNFIKDLSSQLDQYKTIDVLINNAGINKIDNFIETKDKDYHNIHSVNLYAPYQISKLIVHKMLNNNFGRIINISSIFGKLSKEKRSLYSMSKFGLHGLTVALAAELSKKGILTNTVSPGFINTDLTRKILSKKEMNDLSKSVPIGRFGDPEEIASIILFLASEKNTYITGQNIMIDGGFSIV
ncbi:MAG: SDR family oxidoreductase [Legionellales bacterium]|nr:SDR family oxidoreductase [Legionellales bacterium]|tara:strand:+ start:521 stop:1270 length:750 start_codon:yes stop_codon:yes gene_type:complete